MKKLTKLLFAGVLALAIVPAAVLSLSTHKETPVEAKADSETSMDVYGFSNLKQAFELEHITEIHIRQDLVGERARFNYQDLGGQENKQVCAIHVPSGTRKTVYLHDGAKAIFEQDMEDKFVQNANMAVNLIYVENGAIINIEGSGTLGFGALANCQYNSLFYNLGRIDINSDDVTLIAQGVFEVPVKTIYNGVDGVLGVYGGKIINAGSTDKTSYSVYNYGDSKFICHHGEFYSQYLGNPSGRNTFDYSVYFQDSVAGKTLKANIIRGSFDRVVASSGNPMQYLDPESKAYDSKGNEVTTAMKFNQKITIGPEQIMFTTQPVGGTAKTGKSYVVNYNVKGHPEEVRAVLITNSGRVGLDTTEGYVSDLEHHTVTIPYLSSVKNDATIVLEAAITFHKDSTPERVVYCSNEFHVKWVAYNITFDKGEGSGTMAPATSDQKVYTVPECGFEAPEGKEFLGWEYNGNVYKPLHDITLLDDAVLKAVYRDVTYEFTKQPTSKIEMLGNTIATTFEASFGKAQIMVKEKVGGNYVAKQLLNDNFLFGQYWIAESPSSVGVHTYRFDIILNDTIKASSNDFTFEWTGDNLPEHTITFDAGDGTGTMDPVTITGGSQYSLPKCEFEAPENKVFVGWAVNDPYDLPYDVGTIIDVPFNTTLYAVFDDGFTVHFDINGGAGSMEDIEHVYGEFIVPECEFEAMGLIFVCWNDGAKNYYPGDKAYVYGDFELCAIWADQYYTVSFNANGGSGEMAPQSVAGTVQFSVPECSFTAPSEHVYFYAWSYDGNLYPTESQLPYLEEDAVLYAVWVSRDYTVTYSAGIAAGGENQNLEVPVSALTTIELKNGDIVFEAPAGKHFKEWALGTVDGQKYKSGQDYSVTGNVTFVAVWEDNPTTNEGEGTDVTDKTEDLEGHNNTVRFNANGGSGTMAPVENISGSYTLPACTFTAPSGKEFAGWKVNNQGDLLAVGAKINVSSSVELYAQWKDAGSTVDPTDPTDPTEPETPAKKKSGCGGSIAATSAIISVAALAGVGLFFIRRKEK